MYLWKKIISIFRWHCISVWSLVAIQPFITPNIYSINANRDRNIITTKWKYGPFCSTQQYHRAMDNVTRTMIKKTRSCKGECYIPLLHMSLVMKNPAFCICENKDADHLRGNCAADQRLCFPCFDSTILLLPKYKTSSL